MRCSPANLLWFLVHVPVRGDQVVDLREPGVLDGRHDAAGVSGAGGAAVPRVDEDRLTGGRHKERGVPALHVDDVDIECSGRPGLRDRADHGKRDHQRCD